MAGRIVVFRGSRTASLLLAAIVLAGCPKDEKPAVSLDEARQITAEFAGPKADDARFTPPPRTISDIAAVLNEHRPDEARVASLRALADAESPAGASGADLGAFLNGRANARIEIGRTNEAIDDFERSYEASPEVATLRNLARAYAIAGRLMDSLRTHERAIASLEGQSGNRGKLFGAYAGASRARTAMGDIETAESYVAKAENLFKVMAARKGTREAMASHTDGWLGTIDAARAEVEVYRGDLEAAERSFRGAIEKMESADANLAAMRRTGGGPPDFTFARAQALFHGQLAKVLLRQGRVVEAEVEARKGLKLSLRTFGRDNADTGTIVRALSVVLLEQGRFEESATLSAAAVDILEKAGQDPGSLRRGKAVRELATVKVYLGRHGEALAAFDQLAAVLRSDPQTYRLVLGDALEYGQEMLLAGRVTDAETFFRDLAERRLKNLGPKNYRSAEAQGHLAAALAERGDKSGALALYREAAPILLSSSRLVDDEGGDAKREHNRRFVLERYLALLSEIAGAAASGGDVAGEAFLVADAIRGKAVQQALTASAARAAATDPDLADLVRREQDALNRIGALNAILVDALSAPADQQDPGALKELQTTVDSLRGARSTIREEIERRFPEYADLIDPRPATLDQARVSLRSGELLIATYVGPGRTYVWAVRNDQPARFYAAPLGRAKIDATVARLRRALDPNAATLGDIPAFDVAAAHELYEALLAPAGVALDGSNQLLVVADGALGEIPFSVLVTEPYRLGTEAAGEPLFASYRAVPFLARKMAVTQVPSIASLAALRRLPPGDAARKPFLGFGDPWFSPAQANAAATQSASAGGALATRGMPLVRRSAPATRDLNNAGLGLLPRLPETAEELRSVASALHADPDLDVRTGRDANEQAVLSTDLADRQVVMFATHGLVPGDLNGLTQPALALTAPDVAQVSGDGLLTLDEVVGLKMNADWVVLSACNTAAGDGTGAEAVSGLGRAFFYAGTRALLVTNWPVETTSARNLTTDVFRRQAEDPMLDRAQALRAAMEDLIDGPGYVDPATGRTVFSYAHPIFWAPFSLVGDGGGQAGA